MITAQDFLRQIDSFLESSGMTASAFGRATVNDPNLVGDLRAGRMPNLRTLGRVQSFMTSRDLAADVEDRAAS